MGEEILCLEPIASLELADVWALYPFWSQTPLLWMVLGQKICKSDEHIFVLQTAFQDITESVMRKVAHKDRGTGR